MARWLAPAVVCAAALALTAAQPAAAAPLDAAVAHDLKFAASQLNRTLAEVPSGSYPHMIGSTGTWVTRPAGWWISGFFPGSLWMMYRATRDPAWRSAAAARQAGIESQKTNRTTHDLGFMLFDSFGNGWKLTGDDAYRQVVLTAAGSLDTRYSAIVHATRSWNNTSSDSPTDFKVIVDNMMNLELLHWASKHGGSSAYGAHALEHALTTAREHVRADGSTHHLVVFDQNTGAVRRKQTVQGYSNSSTWSRGQAWAVYGFTLAYRETGDSRMLDTARRVADYYMAHLPADSVPYWDFQAPGIPNEPRDSSAAAVAASGLIELAQLDPDPLRGRRYLGVAEATLASLSSPAYLAEGTSSRSILLHGTSNKPAGEYDRGLIYGDYYFLEALLRYRDLAAASGGSADFNGDGYAEAAAGAYGESSRAGAVNVASGSSSGPSSSGARQFLQGAAGGTTEPDDRFGAAIASGDFNRDGYADMAVGAPREDSGAGVVNVLPGGAAGLTSTGARQLTQVGSGEAEPDDQFGYALSSGDYNGDGYADLAVGAPYEDNGDLVNVGRVTVFYGSAGGLTATGATSFGQEGAGGAATAAHERFGQALASGDFDADGRSDLAVGAPGEARDVGAINLVPGSAAGLTASGAKQMTQSQAGGGAEGGDRFGGALAVGLFNGDGFADLAIGAPDESRTSGSSVGAVNVVYGSAGGIVSTGARELDQSNASGAVEAGDRFGFALAAGDFDGDGHSDLAVGAPYEDTAAGADAGAVSLLNGSAGGVTATGARELDQGAAGGLPEAADRFGWSVGAGDFNGDGRSDLAAAAPTEDTAAGVDVGVLNILLGSAGGPSTSGARELSQDSFGGVAKGGDTFGYAVR
ncbi:MAG TPA: glycoside hydrolase family 88 protein [Thermoleophilaceae bacterium]|nr:glycoside hydrolase family 88 protein [Thermoleophilaceae bacterium]